MRVNIDHIHLNTSNLNETVSFLENALGGRLIKTFEGASGVKISRVDLGDVYVNIYHNKPAAMNNPDPEAAVIHHFGVKVSNLDALAAELKKKGVKFIKDVAQLNENMKFAFIKGPDNLVIELMEGSLD